MASPAAPELVEDVEAVRARIAAALAHMPKLVAVMSGKGGVGKSAVAVNLAVALAQRGVRVGLLDADLHGPSVAKMLGLRGQPVRVGGDGRLRPVPGPVGVAVQSMDFFLQGNQALDWDGPKGEGGALRSAMELAALGDLLGRTDWDAQELLVVDLAPGSDRLPALARLLPPLVSALAVTLPTEVAMLAVERSLRRAQEAGVPVLGIVENCASAVCGVCGAEGPLYHEASADSLADRTGFEVVCRLPFDRELSRAADEGRPFLEGPGRSSAVGQALAGLAERIATFEHPGPEGESW